MSNNQINNTVKKWLVISWSSHGNQTMPYGQCIEYVNGTREEAEVKARKYIPQYSPVGIVEEII